MATIVVGTNSYITEAELATYALDRGITIAQADTKPLIIKALDYIESRKYIGYKTAQSQPLQFPRILCGSIYSRPYPLNQFSSNTFTSCEYDSETVPNEIKTAQCIAAILVGQGQELQPIVSQAVKREKVDVIEVEYQDNTTGTTQFTALSDILRPFLKSGISGVRV